MSNNIQQIHDLSQATEVNSTDVIAIDTGSATYKVPMSLLVSLMGALGLTPANIGAMAASPNSIELNPGSGQSHGGFIDFHYAGSSADYTSRIIENASGRLHIPGELTLGTPLGIGNGGTGATSAYDAAENIGVALAMNGDEWTLATMYPKMTKVPVPGSALLWVSPTVSKLLSGNKINSYCTIVASRTNASSWRFLLFSNDGNIYNWGLSGWTSASATPTIGTVYKFTGTAI